MLRSGPPRRAEAAELKPVAVVSLPGYNNLLDDAAYLGKLADRPELDKLLTGMMAVVTQGKELVGLDRTRPWGAMVQTDGETLFVYGFLPVTNLKKLLAVLEPNTDGIQRQEDGLYLVKPKHAGQKRLYVKEQAGWAFLSDKPEQLAATLADPTPLLAGIVKRYEIAVRPVAVPRMPVAMQEMFLAQVRQKADRDLENQRPDESPADFALRKKGWARGAQRPERVVNDANVLTLGWALDKQAQKTFLDLTVTAREGTATAAQLALVPPIRSALGGFRVPGEAFTASGVGRLPAAKIAILNDVIDAVHAHAQESIEKKPKSAEHRTRRRSGRQLDPSVAKNDRRRTQRHGPLGIAGPQGGDPCGRDLRGRRHALRQGGPRFKDLLDRENPTVASWVKLNAEHRAGVTSHEATIPIPADARIAKKWCGCLARNCTWCWALARTPRIWPPVATPRKC